MCLVLFLGSRAHPGNAQSGAEHVAGAGADESPLQDGHMDTDEVDDDSTELQPPCLRKRLKEAEAKARAWLEQQHSAVRLFQCQECPFLANFFYSAVDRA